MQALQHARRLHTCIRGADCRAGVSTVQLWAHDTAWRQEWCAGGHRNHPPEKPRSSLTNNTTSTRRLPSMKELPHACQPCMPHSLYTSLQSWVCSTAQRSYERWIDTGATLVSVLHMLFTAPGRVARSFQLV